MISFDVYKLHYSNSGNPFISITENRTLEGGFYNLHASTITCIMLLLAGGSSIVVAVKTGRKREAAGRKRTRRVMPRNLPLNQERPLDRGKLIVELLVLPSCITYSRIHPLLNSIPALLFTST